MEKLFNDFKGLENAIRTARARSLEHRATYRAPHLEAGPCRSNSVLVRKANRTCDDA